EETVKIVFTVTHISSGKTADTAEIDVIVAAKSTEVVAAVSTVNATNGTLTIVLDKTPTVDPVAGDFTATKAIDGGQ
ncbi:hypothetical protein GSQ54_22655, partial [Clostridioides difficile]|nr:hypothetical protein [Clostridioides difficile]